MVVDREAKLATRPMGDANRDAVTPLHQIIELIMHCNWTEL